MKKKKWFSLLFIGVSLGLSGQGVFADPVEPRGTVELQQTSGETFRAEIKGDEHLSYGVVEGTQELVMTGKTKDWYYAVKDPKTNQLVASTKKYNVDPKPANAAYEKDLSSVIVPVTEVTTTKSPTLGRSVKQNRNMLVVMIEFNDTPLDYTEKDWYNRIFAANQESVNDYYNEATKGMIQFKPVPIAQKNAVDGVVKIKLNKKHPNSGFLTSAEGKFTLPRQMLNEALNQEKELLNLKQYDRDKNGTISPDELHILAVFSGYAASATSASTGVSPTIWPHKWSGGIDIDGLKVQTYTAVTDKRKYYLSDKDQQSTIGVVVHETAHDLGLPDLYNPTGTEGAGLGVYSIMGSTHTTMNGKPSGAYPVHFDAYSKVKLGLVEPIVIKKEQTININELQQNNFNVIKVETTDPNQYYLIENRQMKGFDRALQPYIHSGGIGIYYVNENIKSNAGAGKQIVTLVEADENIVGYSKLNKKLTRGLDGFYYKGIGIHNVSQPTELRKDTIPSSLLENYIHPKFDIKINDPSSDSMSVTFKAIGKN